MLLHHLWRTSLLRVAWLKINCNAVELLFLVAIDPSSEISVSCGFLGVSKTDFVGDEGGSGIDEFEVESWIWSSSFLFSEDETSFIFFKLGVKTSLLRENSPLRDIGIGVIPSRRGLALYGNLILRLNAELGELNSTPFLVKHMAGDCSKSVKHMHDGSDYNFGIRTAVQVDNFGVGGWIFEGVDKFDKFSVERPRSANEMLVLVNF